MRMPFSYVSIVMEKEKEKKKMWEKPGLPSVKETKTQKNCYPAPTREFGQSHNLSSITLLKSLFVCILKDLKTTQIPNSFGQTESSPRSDVLNSYKAGVFLKDECWVLDWSPISRSKMGTATVH